MTGDPTTQNMVDLFDALAPVTGNTAKVHCLLVLERHLETHDQVAILDVGCIGPDPLEFWRPLMDRYASRFTLDGIDVQGVERGVAAARERGWNNVRLREGSGYTLTRLFQRDRFDVVIATQVLEHMRRWRDFLKEARTVLRTGGTLIVTFDSGDFLSDAGWLERGRHLVKQTLAVLGNERYWDVPVGGEDVARAASDTGFEIVEHRYFNLHPFKRLHNHVVPAETKNRTLRHWYQLEFALNTIGALPAAKGYFMGQYCALRKR